MICAPLARYRSPLCLRVSVVQLLLLVITICRALTAAGLVLAALQVPAQRFCEARVAPGTQCRGPGREYRLRLGFVAFAHVMAPMRCDSAAGPEA